MVSGSCQTLALTKSNFGPMDCKRSESDSTGPYLSIDLWYVMVRSLVRPHEVIGGRLRRIRLAGQGGYRNFVISECEDSLPGWGDLSQLVLQECTERVSKTRSRLVHWFGLRIIFGVDLGYFCIWDPPFCSLFEDCEKPVDFSIYQVMFFQLSGTVRLQNMF